MDDRVTKEPIRRRTPRAKRLEERPPTLEDVRALDAKVAAAEAEARRRWTPGEARIIQLLEVLVKRAGGSAPPVMSAKDVLTTEEAERYDAGWADVSRGFAGAARQWNRRGVERDGGDLPPAGGTPPEEFFARREPEDRVRR